MQAWPHRSASLKALGAIGVRLVEHRTPVCTGRGRANKGEFKHMNHDSQAQRGFPRRWFYEPLTTIYKGAPC